MGYYELTDICCTVTALVGVTSNNGDEPLAPVPHPELTEIPFAPKTVTNNSFSNIPCTKHERTFYLGHVSKCC